MMQRGLWNLLLDKMKMTASTSGNEGRIVNISSIAHLHMYENGIMFDKLNDKAGLGIFCSLLLLRDAATAPNVGDRVPYAIVKVAKGSKIWSMANYNLIGSLPSTLEIRAMTISSELIYLGCKFGAVKIWSKEKLDRVGAFQTCTSGGQETTEEQWMPKKTVVAVTTMMTGYCKEGRMETARSLFQEIQFKDLVSWNAIIAGYAHNGHGEEALKLYYHMLETGN